MPTYAGFKYGERVYGEAGRTTTRSYLFAQVVDYGTVRVQVEMADAGGVDYVLLRSANGAAEDPSAGHPVASGTASTPIFTVTDDGSSGVVVSAGMTYYTLFLLDDYGMWVKDAATSVMVPAFRNTLAKMVGILPSLYTSEDHNPVSPSVMDSDLANFLYGLALTYDELAVYIDTMLPENRTKGVTRRLHDTFAKGAGMPTEYTIGVAASARLFRESGYIYRNKGTLAGIAAYVEALTGWQTTVTEGGNKMLSLDDASFETGIGNWGHTGATLAKEAVAGPTIADEDPSAPFSRLGVGLATLTATTATLTLPGDLARGNAIPVTAGATYHVGIPIQAKTGTPTVQPKVRWLDTTGTVLSTDDMDSTASTGSWATISAALVAPAGARYAVLLLDLSGSVSDAVRLDMLSFSESDTGYHDPRTVTVVCQPTRVNLVADPAMSADPVIWSYTGDGTIAATTDHPLYGPKTAKVTGTNWYVSGNEIPVIPGYEYTLTASGWLDGGTVEALIEWVDAGYYSLANTAITFDDLTGWDRQSVTATAPPDAAAAFISFTGVGTAYLGGVVFERASASQNFFTGSQADVYAQDGLWSDSTASSYSLLYPGRLAKLARLEQTLPYYLPVGVTGRVLLWNSPDPEVVAVVPTGTATPDAPPAG